MRKPQNGVNEMEQSSIIIHKGGKEDKYQIYVEDYVLSFLKEETGTLEMSEFYFYGFQEKDGRKYMIYGVGRNRSLTVFDKYNLLEEVGCRLTQAGPVFLIREEDGTKYEIKGYEVFYQDNCEMQNYLIEEKKKDTGDIQENRNGRAERFTYAGGTERPKAVARRTPHSVITVQLGVILVALVAIVINSTNSYDKMQDLNQSAEEVFFAMENQEAEDVTVPDNEKAEIVVGRDVTSEEDILKLATIENEEQGGEQEDSLVSKEQENGEPAAGEAVQQGDEETASGETVQQGDEESASGEITQQKIEADTSGKEDSEEDNSDKEASGQQTSGGEEQVEALSRNVTRYYEVERGDTLYTICQKIYGDTTYVQKICELNQITNPDNIRYGQKIILP